MKKMLYIFIGLCFVLITAFSQNAVEYGQLKSKRVVDNIEILGGPSLFLPNDHGYAELIKRTSMGQSSHETFRKWGYGYGLAASRLIGNRFEVSLRVMLERKGYFEEIATFDINGNAYSRSKYEIRANYITYSIIPTFYVTKAKNLGVSLGFCAYDIRKAIGYLRVNYSNGQYLPPIGTFDVTDGFLNPEWGILSAIEYSYPISSRFRLSASAQFVLGISNMREQNQYTLSGCNLISMLSVKYYLTRL